VSSQFHVAPQERHRATHLRYHPAIDPRASSRDLIAFFALACLITWGCAWPLVSASLQGTTPSEGTMAIAGLSAFGPTLAAVIVAARRGEARGVFRPWRTHPGWVLLALFSPMALQVIAVAIETLLGGSPSAWVHPPVGSEQIAAMIVFSIGEEFGWRGYAHPRMVARFGPATGSLLLGIGWALWHLMFLVSPQTGRVEPLLLVMMLSLPLWSVIYAWFLQRGRGSLAIAIALHAGAHLDNSSRIDADEVRLRVITLIVVAIAAVFAARSLRRGSTSGHLEPAAR
jgi:membrane protease YdiL (CAAX protease family)